MEEDINEVLKSAEQIGYIVGKYGTQKEKDLLSVLLADWQEVRVKNKEQEKMIELYEEKLMFALSPTTHELAQDTKQNFKKIIRENINEDTYTIKKVLKAYWNKKAR